MKKIVGRIFLLVLLVLAVGAGAAWFYGDAIFEALRPQLLALLSRALDAEVAARDLKPSLYPELGFKLGGVRVYPHPSCGVVKADAVTLRMNLRALLAGRYEITLLSFEGLSAILKREGGGVSLVPEAGRRCDRAPAASPAAAAPPAAAASAAALNLRAFLVKHARVSIQEAGRETLVEISHLQGRGFIEPGHLGLQQAAVQGRIGSFPVRAVLAEAIWKAGEGSAALRGGRLEVGESTMAIEFDYGPAGVWNAAVRGEQVALATAAQLAAIIEGKRRVLPSGTIDFDVRAQSGPGGAAQLEGQINARAIELKPWQLAGRSLELAQIRIRWDGAALLEARGNAVTEGFQITDGGIRYQADEVKGPIAFKAAAKGWSIESEQSVRGFGFDDGATKIENTDAVLQDIRAAVSPAGDVKVSVNLNGSAVRLRHPLVEVLSARRVEAPIKVDVPARGGYRVEGPVSIKDGAVNLAGRELRALTGTVPILVSAPLRKFSAQNVHGMCRGVELKLDGQFVMEPHQYVCAPLELRLGAAGMIRSEGSISRRAERRFSGLVTAASVQSADMWACFAREGASPLAGLFREVNGQITGTMTAPLDALKGSGRFVFSEGRIKGFYLPDALGRALSAVPVLGGRGASKGVDDLARDAITSAEVRIADRRAVFSKISHRRKEFTVNGEISVGFDGTLSGAARAVFLRETLGVLGGPFGALGRWVASGGSVAIPFDVKGTVTAPEVAVDVASLTKRLSGLSLVESMVRGTVDLGKGAVQSLGGRGKSARKDAN